MQMELEMYLQRHKLRGGGYLLRLFSREPNNHI